MVRSIFAASSTVRLKLLRRASIETIRASDPSLPDTSPTKLTKSPTTTDFGPISRAFIAVTIAPSLVMQVVRPRSTVVTSAWTASECEGRSLLRGRVRRAGRIRASDSSNSRGVMKSNSAKVQESQEVFCALSQRFQFRYQAQLNQ